MEQVLLKATIREGTGKQAVKKFRAQGLIPAVVYGEGKKPLSLVLKKGDFIKFVHEHHGGENIVIDLMISEEKGKKEEKKAVLIKEIQLDPVKDDVLHIDFNQISLTKKIKVNVSVEAKGESSGVKQNQGVLNHILWEVEVECLPTQIPEKLFVDVTALGIGDSVFVKDMVIPENIRILTAPGEIVITCAPPSKEEAKPAEEEEAAVGAEPEVIKKEKAKEDEAEEAPAKAAAAEEKKPKETK